jgi:hypothetical protein
MIAPQELLYMSLAQLRTLAAFLDEQLGEDAGESDYPTPETHACNEILRSLQGLIVRAQAASRPPPLLAIPEDSGDIAVRGDV